MVYLNFLISHITQGFFSGGRLGSSLVIRAIMIGALAFVSVFNDLNYIFYKITHLETRSTGPL